MAAGGAERVCADRPAGRIGGTNDASPPGAPRTSALQRAAGLTSLTPRAAGWAGARGRSQRPKEGTPMSDERQGTQEPQAVLAATQPGPPLPVATPGPPPLSAAERVRSAAQRRSESDYIFHYWTALGWTILTLGIYGFYVFYQLIRRMRDHNARRLELLDAATTVAWEQAARQGLQQELAPSFQRAASHLAV